MPQSKKPKVSKSAQLAAARLRVSQIGEALKAADDEVKRLVEALRQARERSAELAADQAVAEVALDQLLPLGKLALAYLRRCAAAQPPGIRSSAAGRQEYKTRQKLLRLGFIKMVIVPRASGFGCDDYWACTESGKAKLRESDEASE